MTDLAELLTECDTHGIRLFPAGDVGLTIDAPQGTLTRDLTGRLKAKKKELLAILRPEADTHTSAHEAAVDVRPTEQAAVDDESNCVNESFRTPPEAAEPRCRCHKEQRWWRSVFGDHLICGICHPPVTPGVLREWMHEMSSKME